MAVTLTANPMLAAGAMTAAPAQPAAPAAFELPTPTGRFAVGTASWRLTDRSRPETFAPGEFRQVEVIAWYPATPGAGATAPYLREGLGEVRPFAKLFGAEGSGIIPRSPRVCGSVPVTRGRVAVMSRSGTPPCADDMRDRWRRSDRR